MKLLRLTLRNFKGATEFVLHPQGQDVSIWGDNGTGKTSLADAWFWLLFGKDSLNRADFEIKTLDGAGKPRPGLEHSVEAELEVDGGNLTLCKTYKETWTKSRGSATKEFTGHTTDHYVNTVPVQKKEYDGRVASICTEKAFRLLTDPTYFNTQLHWQERRSMLLAMCGDVSDADVITGNRKLADLPGILGTHKLEDYRKIIAARRKEINGELERIPVRIDEVSRTMPAPGVTDPEILDAAIATASGKLQAAQERRATASAGGAVAEKTTRIRQIEGEMQEILNRLRSEGADVRVAAQQRVMAKDQEIAQAESSLLLLRGRMQSGNAERQRLEPRIAALRTQFAIEQAKVFTAGEMCPTCGAAIAEEKVEAAKAEFNTAKAKKLAEIQTDGKALRATSDELAAQIEGWTAEAAALEQGIAALRQEKAAIDVPAAPMVDGGSDPGYSALVQEKLAIESQLEDLRADASSALLEIDQQIAAAQVDLEAAQAAKASAEQRAQAEERISQLQARERELAAEFEKLDRELFLTEEFVRAKVAMLTSRINSRFEIARFKLFDEQVNGAISECCEVMVGGVPYGSLNHGSRLNVGLDIINTLADHQGFAPPVFVDNAESVTALLPTRGQQIRLIVSASDATLRTQTSQRAQPAQKELISA